METSPAPSSSRIDVLDGLRGFAILWIMWVHLFEWVALPGWCGIWFFGLRLSPFTLLSNGTRGVPLFFILSGFVLYLPYVVGLRTLTSWKDALTFYKRRARRLLPLYYLHILIIAAILRSDISPLETFKKLFWLLSFLMPFHNMYEISGDYNLVLWTLGVEVWFCILMPFIIWTARRVGMSTVILLFTILSLCLRFYYALQVHDTGYDLYTHMNTLGTMLVDFVIGMAIAEEYGRKRSDTVRNPWLVIGILMSLFALLISDVTRQGQAPLLLYSFNEVIIVIGFAIFMYGLLLTRQRVIRKIFTNWPIQMIGMMCYSIYLWHYPMLWPMRPNLNVYRFVRYIFLTFSISFLSYRYIEFGFVKDIRTLLPRRDHKPSRQEHLAIVSQ